jgi:hypothetical protein
MEWKYTLSHFRSVWFGQAWQWQEKNSQMFWALEAGFPGAWQWQGKKERKEAPILELVSFSTSSLA